jgi:hypothetical protein
VHTAAFPILAHRSVPARALPSPDVPGVAPADDPHAGHARARLRLGMGGVGAQLLLALTAVALDLPGRWLPWEIDQPLPIAAACAVAGLLPAVLLQLPFDVAGGLRARRAAPDARRWRREWARGVGTQLLVWLLALAALMAGARIAGAAGAFAAGVLAQLVLLGVRGTLARCAADLPDADGATSAIVARAAREVGMPAVRIRVVAAEDPSFVGGWTGARARTLVVPARWATLSRRALAAQLARRASTRRASHHYGVLLALAWNAAGLALALWGAGVDARAAAGVVTLVALVVPWSFLGLLLLPTPSRTAVLAADAGAARVVGPGAVQDAIAALDAWQDHEPTRTRLVETIFHPVPARLRRMAALRDGRAPRGAGAHQAARHALYLAWGLASPLSRAVHCNVGRPALWVLFPGD